MSGGMYSFASGSRVRSESISMKAEMFCIEEMERRLVRLREWMGLHEWDGVFVENQANAHYLSGFKGEPATLWVTQEEALLMTSYRSEPWAMRQTQTFEVKCEAKPVERIRGMIDLHTMRISVDSQITHARLLALRESLNAQAIEPTSGLEELRRIKSEAEVARLEYSQRVNEKIFEKVIQKIRPGMSERAAQGIILQEMAVIEEVDGPSFKPIVAAGPNAWEIHHLPDDTILQEGDMVIIDHGVMVAGYASDMTRTICLGKATDRMKEVHFKVREAQLAAMACIKDDVSAVKVDAAAREIIEAAGFGRGYTHGLGHGIGIETHDATLRVSPWVGDLKLKSGMALTVEPGIYLENEFGVRTEDVVIVREDGLLNLTNITHDLIEITN